LFESSISMNIRLDPFFSFSSLILFVVIFFNTVSAQLAANDRDMAIGMLEQARDAVKKNYYDPKYHGVDLEKVFQESKSAMKEARTRDELMLIVARFLSNLDDSHTNFIPPNRAADFDYGWQVEMVGDDCYVTAIKPKTDAEAKGLRVGDKVVTIDGFTIVRENISQLYQRYYNLMPASGVRFVVLSPGDTKPHVVDVATKISRTSASISQEDWETKYYRKGWDIGRKDYWYEYGNDLLVWRMSTFGSSERQLDPMKTHVDVMMGKARNAKTLILDLRNNGGGLVEIEKYLLGYFFDKDVRIGDEKSRKESKERIAKSQGADTFKGNLIVLVDSTSASAAEVVTRIIQLEKRGKIIGDKTAGAVMTSDFQLMNVGTGGSLYFATTVTVRDLIMPDGKSLEKRGVIPDELKLPTGKDMSELKDPVLSYAAKLAGVDISPEKAGTMFPIEWPKL
jgi:C-terminal processing protease CtpA/Prc